MTDKIKTAIIGIALIIVSLFLYFFFRHKLVENHYVEQMTTASQTIYKELNKADADYHNDSDNLSNSLRTITQKHDPVALIAASDETNTVKTISKNNKYIPSGYVFDSILNDFTRSKIRIPAGKRLIKKTYYKTENNKRVGHEFYFFLQQTPHHNYLIVFPYEPSATIKTRFALEIMLVIVINIIISVFLYILMQKQKSPVLHKDQTIVELKRDKRPIEKKEKISGKDTAAVATQTLQKSVYEFFSKLQEFVSPEAISLYSKTQDLTMIKRFELRGNSFITIDSVSFEVFSIDNDIGKELQQSIPIISEEGKKIMLPITYDNSLLGCLILTRNSQFSSDEISGIKSEITSIVKPVQDFLVINNVLIDNDTGIFSKAYFDMKIHEVEKQFSGENKPFAVLAFSLFEDPFILNDLQMIKLIKLIAPTVAESLSQNDIICRYDELITAILVEKTTEEAENAGNNLRNSLSKFKVKISEDTVVKLSPHIGIACTDSSPKKGVAQEAFNDLFRQIGR